jgi:hypothetical protein
MLRYEGWFRFSGQKNVKQIDVNHPGETIRAGHQPVGQVEGEQRE